VPNLNYFIVPGPVRVFLFKSSRKKPLNFDNPLIYSRFRKNAVVFGKVAAVCSPRDILGQ